MQVRALDSQSYVLTLGRFGNFGFDVEPTIALRLLPQEERVYRIETLPLPEEGNELQDLYDIDFKARMELKPWHQLDPDAPQDATAVSWDLDLSV